jgi:hypothetical protein
VLPYVAARLPIAVDISKRSAVYLTLGVGTPSEAKAEVQIRGKVLIAWSTKTLEMRPLHHSRIKSITA